MAPSQVCAEHREAAAIATCDRCGRFVCERCGSRERPADKWRCSACAALTERSQQREHRRRWLSRTLALSHALIGLLIVALSLAASVRIFENEGAMPWSLVAWGLFMGGPQLVCAALTALTRHPAASWVGLGWYSLFFLTASLLGAGGLMLFIVILCSTLALFALVRSVQLFLHRRRLPA